MPPRVALSSSFSDLYSLISMTRENANEIYIPQSFYCSWNELFILLTFLVVCDSGFESLFLIEDYENQNLSTTVVHSRQAHHLFVLSLKPSNRWICFSAAFVIIQLLLLLLLKRGMCGSAHNSSSRLLPRSQVQFPCSLMGLHQLKGQGNVHKATPQSPKVGREQEPTLASCSSLAQNRFHPAL